MGFANNIKTNLDRTVSIDRLSKSVFLFILSPLFHHYGFESIL